MSWYCSCRSDRFAFSTERGTSSSTAEFLMDLSDLKFWSAIAGMIAMAILAVVALAGYDRGCALNVISLNLHMFTPCK